MRIAIDARSIHRHLGGIGRAALELLRELDRESRGHRIQAIAGPQFPTDPALQQVELIRTDGAMIDEEFEQLHLPPLLRRLQADVYLNPTFSVPALKTTRRQIAIIHDIVFEDQPDWVEPRLRGYLRRWARFAAQHADHVVTVSEHAKSRIRDVYRVPAKRITRIYNGVSAPSAAPLEAAASEAILRRLNVDQPFLLYIGSVEKKKGIRQLFEAFARFAGEGNPGLLVLAGAAGGSPSEVDHLRRRPDIHHKVRRLGYVSEEERLTLLGRCAAFVYPSLYEGFGLPPLEALALGVPTVVSNRTSIPEVVGDAALCVDVEDPEAFARGIHRAMTDAAFRAKARKDGPARAGAFRWSSSAAQLLDLCESLEAA